MANQSIFSTVPGAKAGADLSSSDKLFVKFNASGEIIACSAQGEAAIGVLVGEPADDDPAVVATVGSVAKVKSSTGGVTAGDPICTSTAGKAETALTGDYILGYAMDTTAAADEIVSVLITLNGRVA